METKAAYFVCESKQSLHLFFPWTLRSRKNSHLFRAILTAVYGLRTFCRPTPFFTMRTSMNLRHSITVFRPPVGTPLPTLVFAGLRRLKYVDGCRQGDIGTALPSLVFAGLRQCTSCRRTLPKFVDSCRQTLVSPTLFRRLKLVVPNLKNLHPATFFYMGLLL
jgi:hypothetical protein